VAGDAGDWVAALASAGWSRRELWLACFALRADASEVELDRYLRGLAVPSASERNVIAQALNERLHDLGLERPVRAPKSD
jgi:hypothetical protein